MTELPAPSPAWPVAYPRHHGSWTLKGSNGTWGVYDPASGGVDTVNPADDRALPALAPALERGDLLAYRAGRRAVIATPNSFIKIVRPKRLDDLAATHRWLTDTAANVATPGVVANDDRGGLELSTVEGTPLHRCLRGHATEQQLHNVIDRIADGLVELHASPTATHFPTRTPDPPERWITTVTAADPAIGAQLTDVAANLPALPAVALTVTHGDLHDKNIFITPSRVGLIDLDSVALGAPEDDVANLAVHIQLRALQWSGTPRNSATLTARLIERCDARQTLDPDRVAATIAHTWFRLGCIYHFRSASRHLVPELLRRALDAR